MKNKNIEPEFDELLSEQRVTTDREVSQSIVNIVTDKLEAHMISLDLLQELIDYLLDSILLQINPVIRGDMFELLERIHQKNPSVSIDLEILIELFDDNDPSLIANTLLLFPIATQRQKHRTIAERYLNHSDRFVAANARYAIKYLTR